MIALSRLSFSKKLFLVNLGYLLPCAVLVFFLVKEKNGQLSFSDNERAGLEFQRPLTSLLLHVSQHKVLTLAQSLAPTEAEDKLLATRRSVEGDLVSLDAAEERYGVQLAFGDAELNARKRLNSSPRLLRSSWDALHSSPSPITEKLAAHDRLLGDILGGITHVGDSSNLILDPDLDSYYLMDISLIALPRAMDHLQQLLVLVQKFPSDLSQLPKEQLTQLAAAAFQLRDDLVRITGDVQTAVNEDKNFYGQQTSLQRDLPLDLKNFSSVLERLLRDLDGILRLKQGEKAPALQSSVWQQGLDTLDASFIFWNKTATELDKLLETRMKQHAWERIVALILSFLAWMPPALLALFTVHRLSRSFTQAVARLEREAEGANASSTQLAAASSMVSSGSTEQAAAIQETGASMSEIASMVARSSTQAHSSQDLARKVTEKASEGCSVMERLVLSMESIHDANAQLQNISNIIHEISSKTNVINDIVGKTQLLSFNASIEAARAGQHGRGFAVVAEEVGNLAQTSGNAAKGIRDLIEDSQKQVSHILKTTLERVAEGKAVSEQAQTIFGDIAQDISTISTQVEGVTEAAHEQQLGIEQISKAMIQMDQTTQSNNKAAHLAAQLSDQLAGQSQKLTQIAHSISRLVLGPKPTNDAGENPRSPGPKSAQGHDRAHSAHIENMTLQSAARGADDDAALLDSFSRRQQNLSPSSSGLNADHEAFKEAV